MWLSFPWPWFIVKKRPKMNPKDFYKNGAVVQLVRTPACQAGGREFKSRQSRTKPRREMGFFILSILEKI